MKKILDLETIYCRSFQFVMKIGMNILPWSVPKTIKGMGAVKKLPKAIWHNNYRKPLIVTDKILVEMHLLDGMLVAMQDIGLEYAIFDGVAPNPTDINIEEGALLYRKNQCDCLIAFGGGSPMDCAKGIGARIARPHKKIRRMQ